MAASGLFDAIMGFVNYARRERRANRIRHWNAIRGAVEGFATNQDGRPAMEYSYRIGSQQYFGSVGGRTSAQSYGPAPAGWEIQVRYDPANPAVSSVLPGDNPYLSFEIDEDRL
jgi:hypothetical protein